MLHSSCRCASAGSAVETHPTKATPLLGLPGSPAVPLTVIDEVLNTCPLVGLAMATVGAVMSGGL